jgi:hypothetical protein
VKDTYSATVQAGKREALDLARLAEMPSVNSDRTVDSISAKIVAPVNTSSTSAGSAVDLYFDRRGGEEAAVAVDGTTDLTTNGATTTNLTTNGATTIDLTTNGATTTDLTTNGATAAERN